MFELIATAVIAGVVGAGLGLRWWYNRNTLRKSGAGLLSFASSLPAIPGCWLQILGEVHATLVREGLSYVDGQAYAGLIRTLPETLPHWNVAGEAIHLYADKPEMREGRFGKPFPGMAWSALAGVCLERNQGGAAAIAYAMKNIVHAPGWSFHLSDILRQPQGHHALADWLRASRDEHYIWPDESRTPRTEILELVLSGTKLDQEEKLALLHHILEQFRDELPEPREQLVGTQFRGKQILGAFMRNHPFALARVLGPSFARNIADLFRLPLADPLSVQSYACTVDTIRPSVYHGYLICPICADPSHLQAGIQTITGLYGSLPDGTPTEDVVYRLLALPLNQEVLKGLDNIVVGQGKEADRFVDQAMVMLDLGASIPITIHPAAGLSQASIRMVEEYLCRISL